MFSVQSYRGTQCSPKYVSGWKLSPGWSSAFIVVGRVLLFVYGRLNNRSVSGSKAVLNAALSLYSGVVFDRRHLYCGVRVAVGVCRCIDLGCRLAALAIDSIPSPSL